MSETAPPTSSPDPVSGSATGSAIASVSGSRSGPTALSRRDIRALVGIMLGVTLGSLDTAIANTALPVIGSELHANAAASIWILNAYQLAMVATLLPLAALGDRIGPRRIFMGGLALFTLASLACACATGLATLSVARGVQGIGAGGIMSVNIALVRLIYPPEKLGRGVGLNALVVGVSFVLGPSVASLILSVAPWPWLFAINVPLGLAAIVSAWPALPYNRPSAYPFDPLAAILTSITFAALILALSVTAQREGLHVILPPLCITLIAGALLLKRQAGHPAPMLPVDLLRRPMFALSTITSITSFTTQSLAFVSLPFYLEQVLHHTPVDTGFLMTSWPVIVALAAPLAGRLSDRYPPGLLGGIGLAILSAGMVSLALLPPQPDTFTLVARMALCGAGFGFFQSPNLRAIMSSAPPSRSSGASGTIAIARLIGQSSGAALVAFCFGIASNDRGPIVALALGAAFAGAGSLASFARLWVPYSEGS